jgi:hypothetical protein
MSQVLSLISVVIICVVAIGAGALLGNIMYRFLRRDLYRRPLNTEELWAETSQEATNEETWAGMLSSETPPEDTQPHTKTVILS